MRSRVAVMGEDRWDVNDSRSVKSGWIWRAFC